MAVLFATTLKDIAYCDSPQYVTVQDTTSATTITLSIYIWQGDKANVPATPQRVLTQNNLVPNGTGITTATFETSNFISEFVEGDTTVGGTNRRGINADTPIPTIYGSTQYNGENGTWFKMSAEAGDGEIDDTVKFATLGKGLYTANINPGTTVADQDYKIYGDHSAKLIGDTDREYIIPVYIGDSSSNNELVGEGLFFNLNTDFGFILNSTNSANQIGYVVLSDQDWGVFWANGRALEYAITNNAVMPTIFYKLLLTCNSGRPKSLKFLNLAGAVSDFPVNGSDMDKLTVKKTTFNNNSIDVFGSGYDVTAHVKQTFLVDTVQSVDLETGWLYEEANDMMSALLVSTLSWYELDGLIQPTHITTARQKFIRRLYKREMGYNITLEIANPLLNNVR